MTSFYHAAMETMISAAALKEEGLRLLDDVGPDGIVITKHGRPVARLVPIQARSRDLIGALEGELEIKGDVMSTNLERVAQSQYSRPAARSWRPTRRTS